jgi:hypothetical protein
MAFGMLELRWSDEPSGVLCGDTPLDGTEGRRSPDAGEEARLGPAGRGNVRGRARGSGKHAGQRFADGLGVDPEQDVHAVPCPVRDVGRSAEARRDRSSPSRPASGVAV